MFVRAGPFRVLRSALLARPLPARPLISRRLLKLLIVSLGKRLLIIAFLSVIKVRNGCVTVASLRVKKLLLMLFVTTSTADSHLTLLRVLIDGRRFLPRITVDCFAGRWHRLLLFKPPLHLLLLADLNCELFEHNRCLMFLIPVLAALPVLLRCDLLNRLDDLR